MEEKNKEMEEKNKIFFRIPLHELYSDSLKYDNTPDKSNAVRKYFMERYTVLLNDFRMFQKITKRKPLIFIGTGLSFKSGIIKWYDSLCYMANRFKELNSDLGNNKLEEEVINSVFDTMENLLNSSKYDINKRLDLADYMKSSFKIDYKDILRELFLTNSNGKPYKYNYAHELLSGFYKHVRCYITTNYDCLIEDALEEYSKQFNYCFDRIEQVFSFYEIDRLNSFIKKNEDKPFVLKLHGNIKDQNLDNIIMGRYDYSKLTIKYARIFEIIEGMCNKKDDLNGIISFGSSFQDYDLLNLLSYIKGRINLEGARHIIISGIDINFIINNKSKYQENDNKDINSILYGAFTLPYPVLESNKNEKNHEHLKTVLETLLEYFQNN